MYYRPSACILAILATLPNLGHTHPLEEIVVTESHSHHAIDVSEVLIPSPDPASKLEQIPGVSVNRSGTVSGIPQIRGMYGVRVATVVNGQTLGGAGPNAMDPPISYATGDLDELRVYRGIVPVSVAQEAIGGAIVAQSARGEFTEDKTFSADTRLMLGGASINDSYQLNSATYISNHRHRFALGLLSESGDDIAFPNGDILPTQYKRQRYALSWGVRSDNHQFQVDYSRTETGDSGTPTLPMDIQWIDGDLLNLAYQWQINDNTVFEGELYGSELDHGMANYSLRPAPVKPARYRQALTDASNRGFNLKLKQNDDHGHWLTGVDGVESKHNATIINPNAAAFFVDNFNNVKRDVLGVFLERLHRFNTHLSGEFGLRYNRVRSDAAPVNGTPAMMMPAATMLRNSFNNTERSQKDNTFDAVAKLWWQRDQHQRFYAGLARKSRAPAYQERYLWLPMQSTGGLADGLTYTGNILLKPETAHEIELGWDYTSDSFTVTPRVFYRDVKNYIQGTASDVPAARMFVQMMNTMNGSNNPAPLRFNNVDASLYGMDLDARWALNDHITAYGALAYVRGERDDVKDNLYRIAPANAKLGITYTTGNWRATIENELLDAQDKISNSNAERATSGYGLLHLSGQWDINAHLSLTGGVDNVLDKHYRDHLSGYNRVRNPNISMGSRLPGPGRNLWLKAVINL